LAHQHNLISSRRAPRVTFENHSHNSYPPGSVDDGNILGKTGKILRENIEPLRDKQRDSEEPLGEKKTVLEPPLCIMRNPTRCARGGFKNAARFE